MADLLTQGKHTIALFLQNGVWMSRWSDTEIVYLFGSDTIPTAYKEETPSSEVLERITEFNPSYDVLLYK